jgi:hypothetical protein
MCHRRKTQNSVDIHTNAKNWIQVAQNRSATGTGIPSLRHGVPTFLFPRTNNSFPVGLKSQENPAGTILKTSSKFSLFLTVLRRKWQISIVYSQIWNLLKCSVTKMLHVILNLLLQCQLFVSLNCRGLEILHQMLRASGTKSWRLVGCLWDCALF